MKRTLAFTALLAASGTSFAAEPLVKLPVFPGENLADVVKRVHPCPLPASDHSLQQVLRINPEVIGKDGKFTLQEKELSVPAAFLTTATSCREPASVATELPLKPHRQAEGVESGGGEAVVAEPKEMEAHEKAAHEAKEHGHESEEPRELNAIRFGTFLEYSKNSTLTSSGAQVDLTSKPVYGFEIEYDRWLSDKVFVGGHYRWGHTGFQELADQELKELSTTENALGVSAGYDLGEKTIVTFDVSAVQIDHVTQETEPSTGDSTVTVGNFWVPKLTVGIKRVFLEFVGVELGGGLEQALYLPAKGIGKTSPAEGAEIFAERELNRTLSVEIGVGAEYGRFGFSDGSYSNTAYGATLGFGIHF